MFCSNCGKPLQPNAQFCGSCGQPVHAAPDATATPGAHAAPPAYIPPAATPPAQPAAPAAPNAALVGLARQLSRVLIWDWIGPLRVAAATLGTSLILAIVFGLATKPSSDHLHWGFKTVYTWLVWVWESMFGVSLVAGASASGSINGAGSGSGSAHAGLGAMPLTLTVLTLFVAAFFFRRAVRNAPNALSAVLLGVRAALLIAVPLWFFSLFASLSLDDLVKFAGGSNSTSTYINGNSVSLDQLHSSGVNWSFALTVSSTQAFFISLLLMIGLFAALTLSRAEWFTGRILSAVRLCLLAPLRALGAIGPALVVAGLIFSFTTLIVRWNSHTGFHSVHPSLSTHNWIILIFTFIAYAGNSGVMALGLGSWGNFGGSFSANWNANIPGNSDIGSGSISCSVQHGISWWAHASNPITSNPCSGFHQEHSFYSVVVPGADWGVWTAAILAPLVLAVVALKILKANGLDGRSMLTSLGTWVVSLLVVIPILGYLAEVGFDVNGNGNLQASSPFGGSYSPSGSGHASGSIGLAGSAVFLIFAYGLLIALIVGLLSGAINKNSFSGLAAIADQARAQQAAQRAAQAQQVPPAYQPPPPAYQPPAQTPPPYQPPSDQQPPPYRG